MQRQKREISEVTLKWIKEGRSQDEVVLENRRTKVEHYDSVRAPERLVCWGFEWQVLTEAYGHSYHAGVFKSLLSGLKELSESKNKRVREGHFPFWGGEYLDGFRGGVPSNLSAKVTYILWCHFGQVFGYNEQDYGDIASLAFTLLFRYDRWRVFEYSCDSLAGQECLDAYGSGMKVHYCLHG